MKTTVSLKDLPSWTHLSLAPFLGLFTLFLLGTSAVQAQQTFIYDKTSHNHYTDLQDAIDNAQDGDTLILRGKFVGNYVIDKPLTLIGKKNTILDGDAAGTVVTIPNLPITVRIENVTIQNGYGAEGGGILNQSVLILDHVKVINNTATESGGGIANVGVATPPSYPTAVVILHSLIANNAAGAGGGIQNAGGKVDLIESKLTHNTALSFGGGLFSLSGSNTIVQSRISNNTAGEAGGGIANEDLSVTAINKSEITENTAPLGGGIYDLASALTVNNSSLSRNAATNIGGGLYNDADSTAVFGFSQVTYNTATNNGGGIFNVSTATTTTTDTDVVNNTPNDFVD